MDPQLRRRPLPVRTRTETSSHLKSGHDFGGPDLALARSATNLPLLPPEHQPHPRRRPHPQLHLQPLQPPHPPPSYHSLSPVSSPVTPLRYTRSATNLQGHHDRPSTAVVDSRGVLPVDFVVDGLPTPPIGYLSPQTTGGSGGGEREIRRIKSSSALSMANTTATYPEAEFASSSQVPATSTASEKWKAALGEAQYFAGGLVSRPAESTRHYSVIRHSHALVWYRGPSTSVSLTILSDVDIPPERTVWLQQKGYSGNMGMSLKALMGTTGDWLDVTPATKAGVEHLPEVDERGIQRDLRRFAKKASGRVKKHVPRETHVVRIPASAVDGYFRLVVCAGRGEKARKNVLCGSPVFRVASTTTEISVTRGASMSTMPLEVGVKVASTVGQQVAKRYAGAATLVLQNKATSTVTKTVSKKVLTNIKRGAVAGRQVIETTGVDGVVTESWKKKRGNAGRYAAAVFEETTVVSLVGPDEGPERPFPVFFDGKVAQSSGISTTELGIPTANVREVRDEVKMRMRGVFAAWACVVPKKGMEDISHDWHEAIVTIGPLRYAPPEIVVKNRIAVHLIHDFDGATFYDARIKVVLMGYLHAPSLAKEDMDVEDVVTQHAEDTMTVLASLGRDNWAVEDVRGERKREKSEMSFGDRIEGVTGTVQGKVDRMPLHWAGVRSEVGMMRDAAYGNGGLWIPR